MRYWIIAIVWIVCSCMIGSKVIYAKESNEVITSHAIASIISNLDEYDGRSDIWLGLRLQLKPGWHTYWINPGDAGEPASVSIQASGAAQQKKYSIKWPVPLPLSENGLQSYVYQGDVVLPIELFLHNSDIDLKKDLSVNIKANWLVCADVCVPEDGQFILKIPSGKGKVSEQNSLIQLALTNLPRLSPFSVYVTSLGELWIKDYKINSSQIQKAWFMPEKSGILGQVSDQKLFLQPGSLMLSLPLIKREPLAKPLLGILTIQDRANIQSYFVNAIVAPLPNQQRHSIPTYNIIFLIISAFLGGVLLNLMPCVFPVIAMKLLSLSRIAQGEYHKRYKSSIAYTCGILCCFILMSCLFAGLRWMGAQIGWGFQFQSVSFVILLCWLLFIISLNFLGVFNIQFSFNMSAKTHAVSSYSADFFTGLLAVLVATPCTAPFMGIAIASALNATLWVSLLIFVGMGLGLALPYVIFACVPSFARILPRPGLWMDILKQFLAFPLMLSCLWLTWVVYQHQQQPFSFLMLLVGLIGIGFIAWLIGMIQQLCMRGVYKRFRIFAVVIIVVLLILLSISFKLCVYNQSDYNIPKQQEKSLPFSSKLLESLRQEHKPVFVNMTASWCLTCMVNDKVALSSDKVQDLFKKKNITYMIGDWTKYDANIGNFLKDYGREGVPLYIYYPAEGEPKILPQILTPQLVVDYLSVSKE